MNRHAILILLAACSGLTQAGSLSITDTIFQTVGTDPGMGPASGGSRDNTNTWTAGEVGRFLVTDGLGVQYGLSVFATSPSGVLKDGTDSLMVVRTVNSQGLTDNGTLSLLVYPGNTGAALTGAWTLNIRFAFYDATFTTAQNMPDLAITTLDLDFNQRYYTLDSDFLSNDLYPGSVVTAAPVLLPGYTGFTAGGNSTFSEARHAVTSFGRTQSEFNVAVGNTSRALYVFEFRNPSLILATPEPSSATFAVGGGMFLMAAAARAFRANRRRSAVQVAA